MKRFTKLLLSGTLILSMGLVACEIVDPPMVSSQQTESSSEIQVSESTTTLATTAPEVTTETTSAAETTTTASTTSETTLAETTPALTEESTSAPSTSITNPYSTEEPTTASSTSEASDSTTRDPIGGLIDDLLNPTDPEEEGSLSHPLNPGETAEFDGYETLFDPFRADVSVQQIFRGSEALRMVKDASSVNPYPEAGYEYLVAQVLVKITDSKNSESVGVSPYYFSLAREDGRMYGDVTLFRSITPVLSTINVGETSIGYICFQVDKDDVNPYIVFLSRANGGIWFRTVPEETAETTTNTFSKN